MTSPDTGRVNTESCSAAVEFATASRRRLGGLVSESALFDQAVARLCGLHAEMRCTAGGITAQTIQGWRDTLDTAIGDLLEVERRARYREVFAVGAALVEATIDGPPGCQAVNREREASVLT